MVRAAHIMEEAEYGDRQRSALGRIGPGAQLIKETEGIAVRLLQDGNNVGHVGGEGTEALLDTLLVSMSANTSSKTASSDPSNAGIWRPACPIRVNRPTVFKETVLLHRVIRNYIHRFKLIPR